MADDYRVPQGPESCLRQQSYQSFNLAILNKFWSPHETFKVLTPEIHGDLLDLDLVVYNVTADYLAP